MNGQAIESARILAVDDEETNIALLKRTLGKAGFTNVHTLTDSRLVVETVESYEPDLILLDLHMPYLDGYQVMEKLSRVLPVDTYLPILVMTADINEDARRRAIAFGARDFITKPFQLNETLLRIRNLLETRLLHTKLARENAGLRAQVAQAEPSTIEVDERRQQLDRVSRAVEGEGLVVVFQPIVDIATGVVVGAEGLSRFSLPPIQPPDVWFREAAEVGLGIHLELAAVRAAAVQMDQIPADAFMSFNVSPDTLRSPMLIEALANVPPSRVVIEMTEQMQYEDDGPVLQAVSDLRKRGFRFAIDDAGAGYAGLDRILRFEPEIIKLDRGLIASVDIDSSRQALIATLTRFADQIGCAVIAEGIESQAEMVALQSLGVRLGQGYHIARPAPLPIAVNDVWSAPAPADAELWLDRDHRVSF